MDNQTKFMFILHGHPGSGKSTIAEILSLSTGAVICNTDSFFYDENGVYVFDASKLGINHEKCFRKAKEACEAGENVIIDNTNTQKKDYGKYVKVAEHFGYQVHHIYLGVNVQSGHQRNTHAVPEEKIQEMAMRLYRDYTGMKL